MQTENEFYRELDKDQDANLVVKEEIDITIEDRIRLIKKVDLGSLVSNHMCDGLMNIMNEYFESLNYTADDDLAEMNKKRLSSPILRRMLAEILIVSAYDITYKMFQDEVKNGEHHERLLADVQS